MAVVGFIQKLNAQINREFYSSNLYLQLSNWCSEHNMNGAASFMRTQAQSKVTHMMSVFNYMKQAGATPIINQIAVPRTHCHSLEELFDYTLTDYRARMDSLSQLTTAAAEANDDATLAFLTELKSDQAKDGQRLQALLGEVRRASDAGLGPAQTDRHLSALMHPLH